MNNEKNILTGLKIANAVYAYLVPVLIILMCYMAVIKKLYLKHHNTSFGRDSGSTLNKVTRIVCILVSAIFKKFFNFIDLVHLRFIKLKLVTTNKNNLLIIFVLYLY